ncbi:leucine-rich repeat domain-containing protein [Urbifossiella limnaea]|uniref:Leucine Rich repeats (2 copies) n=1 Tax=Urbifossiella limnaea TaxID=2528023 RepID=A0A517Y049_9BACT|nr:hypothetical protein [Urbifossiella limnaea]QDU23132.1 Leucine Rich repeats (2 copies) [Urbifossiella limnaea]
MLARVALLAGLFALAASAVPAAGQVKKAPTPKYNVQKAQAAFYALQKTGCRFGMEKDNKDVWFGHVRLVTFPANTTDADLAKAVPHLANLPALTGLDIGSTKVTDAGTAHLTALPKLEALYLDNLEVTGETFGRLAELPELQYLVLHQHDEWRRFGRWGGRAVVNQSPRLTAADLKMLGACTGLTHLEIDLPAGSLAPLARLTDLAYLSAHVPAAASDADLAPFAGATRLQELHLFGGSGLTGAALAHFAGAANLEVITVGEVAVGDVGAKHLGGFTRLTKLDLGNYPYYARPAYTAAYRWNSRGRFGGAQARGAVVDRGKITDAGVKHLTNIVGLKELSLSGHPVTLAGVPEAASWVVMTHLDLDYTRVTDDGAAALARLPVLGELKLTGSAVTGAGFAGGALPKLQYLHLAGAPVTADGLGAIAKAAPALAFLDVNDTPADDSGLRPFARTPAIRDIHAVKSGVTAAGKGVVERGTPGSVVWLEYPEVKAAAAAAAAAEKAMRTPVTRPRTSPAPASGATTKAAPPPAPAVQPRNVRPTTPARPTTSPGRP